MSDPTPADLGIAIVARFRATPALNDGFAGRIYRAKAKADAPGPQLVFRIIRARVARAAEGSEYLGKIVRFTCYASEVTVVAPLRQAVQDAFAFAAVAHARGWTTPWYVHDQSEDEVSKPPTPNMAYKAIVEFEFDEHQGA